MVQGQHHLHKTPRPLPPWSETPLLWLAHLLPPDFWEHRPLPPTSLWTALSTSRFLDLTAGAGLAVDLVKLPTARARFDHVSPTSPTRAVLYGHL